MATRSTAPRNATSTLTQEQVILAALAFIDEHGLEAFSMRNLAKALGVYPTALYWHAGNRDGLLGYAIGRALLEIEPPDDQQPWDGWLAGFARGFRATMHRHPNLAPIVGSQMVTRSLTEFHIVEMILAKLHEAGFRDDDLVDAYNAVTGSVVGFVSVELARLPDDPGWQEAMEGEIRGSSAVTMPHLAANAPRLANRAFGLRWVPVEDAPLDGGFELMLAGVLGGLRERLAQA